MHFGIEPVASSMNPISFRFLSPCRKRPSHAHFSAPLAEAHSEQLTSNREATKLKYIRLIIGPAGYLIVGLPEYLIMHATVVQPWCRTETSTPSASVQLYHGGGPAN